MCSIFAQAKSMDSGKRNDNDLMCATCDRSYSHLR